MSEWRDEDRELLAAYAGGGKAGEAAFAELVRRHVDMVYGAARRQVGSEGHLAEDVVQGVFVLLARKAGGIGRGVSVAGWLYEATRYAAANAVRGERRRRRWEREAAVERKAVAEMAMASSGKHHEEGGVSWEEVGPALDGAMARLRRGDREAIVLRYLEGKSLAEVGRAMGTSEDAAKQRVLRAVGRLREVLVRREGAVAGSVGGVVAMLESARVNGGAPEGVRAAAMKAGLGGNSVAVNIANGANKMMWWAKVKVGVAVVAAVTSVGVGGTVAVRGLAERGKGAPAAAAVQEPEANSPKGAMLKAYRAGRAGDREGVREMIYATTDDERRVADAFAGMMSAGGEITRAMRERWPNDPQVEAGEVAPFTKGREQAILRATVSVEGGRAKLVVEGMGPMFLTRDGGTWRLWAGSMVWTGEGRTEPEAKARRMEKEARVLGEVAGEIRAGKYASAREAFMACQKRIGPVGPATRRK